MSWLDRLLRRRSAHIDPELLAPHLAAVMAGDIAKVTTFLKQCPGLVNAADRHGSALHYATREGHLALLKLLLAKGANPNQRIMTWYGEAAPLHWAATVGRPSEAVELIQHGADMNAATAAGWTPLHLAVDRARLEVVELLVKSGADVNACVTPWLPVGDPTALQMWKAHYALSGATPLDWAEAMKSPIAALLRQHGGKTGLRT